MKAWTLNKPAPVSEYPLRLSERAVPTPSNDEILLRIAACGICRTDLHVVEGDLPVRRSPLIPGHQIVGSVAALGSSIEGFALGDRVEVARLNRTCATCEFCVAGRENLCDEGISLDGLLMAAMQNTQWRPPLSPIVYQMPSTTCRQHHFSAPASSVTGACV